MKLVRLEIRNYRSVKEQVHKEAIVFQGLDCLVGKNNAGKSNILKAILFLLGEEKPSADLYYGRDTSLIIDVCGYFQVEDSDFELLKIENKKERMKEQVLDDGTIGICRRSDKGDMEVIGFYPKEERLRKGRFEYFHGKAWDEKADKEDFRDTMLSEYPELEGFLTEGKEYNKGEWPDAYKRFVRERPDAVEFIKLPASPPTGISADLTNMLPRLIFIPAVKEVSEATKTAKRAELGALLDELSSVVQEELDEAIAQSMTEVHRRLNVIIDDKTGEVSDERHRGVQAIESRITDYVSETFQDVSVLLEFPNPESKVMFDNARVWIKEKGFGDIRVDHVGEGVKRILIFSLVRTLADLRQGRLSVREVEVSGDEEAKEVRQPLLILYEEAELFLHPGLQKILLKAFGSLKESGDQIIFSTHSPFMLQTLLLSTINLVCKDPEAGTQVVEFHKRVNKLGGREQNRLLQIQNVSSYIFADKVLLVEGESDRIVLRKLAPALDPQWDFEQNGIPILSVTGKGDLPLFQAFLTSMGIGVFTLTDLDSIEDIVPRLCENDAVRRIRKELLQRCQELVDAGEFAPRINKRYVNKLIESYEWNDVFERLERLCEALCTDGKPTEEQIGCLQRLLLRGEIDARRRALESGHPDIEILRVSLVESLLDENVLCLNGTIEDYYPCQGDRVEAALDFDPIGMSRDDLCSYFTPLYNGETTDMEAFLSRLFGSQV
jgi:putative ATP-dependent endonuclease of OLD family